MNIEIDDPLLTQALKTSASNAVRVGKRDDDSFGELSNSLFPWEIVFNTREEAKEFATSLNENMSRICGGIRVKNDGSRVVFSPPDLIGYSLAQPLHVALCKSLSLSDDQMEMIQVNVTPLYHSRNSSIYPEITITVRHGDDAGMFETIRKALGEKLGNTELFTTQSYDRDPLFPEEAVSINRYIRPPEKLYQVLNLPIPERMQTPIDSPVISLQ